MCLHYPIRRNPYSLSQNHFEGGGLKIAVQLLGATVLPQNGDEFDFRFPQNADDLDFRFPQNGDELDRRN